MDGKYIVGIFDEEKQVNKFIHALRAQNLFLAEAYTPYPVHSVLEAVKKRTRLKLAAYFYGLFGAAAVLAFLYYTAVISWPINYGGKPFNSFPSFIIITIILTILIVTLTSLATFSARGKLYPGKVAEIIHQRATDDKFVLIVKEDSQTDLHALFSSNGATEITERHTIPPEE